MPQWESTQEEVRTLKYRIRKLKKEKCKYYYKWGFKSQLGEGGVSGYTQGDGGI